MPASLSGTHTAACSSTAFFPDLRNRSYRSKYFRWIPHLRRNCSHCKVFWSKSPQCTCWCVPSTPAFLLQSQQTQQRTYPCQLYALDQGSSSQHTRSAYLQVHLVHRSHPFLNCPSSSNDFNLTSSRGIKCWKGKDRFVNSKSKMSYIPVCCTFSCWSQCSHIQADHWRGRIACLKSGSINLRFFRH